ncbi:hypothetical protein EJB10_03180 [Wolbachia endosymbiont of Brugia malayi]|uniref:hypothetical protein n=1 Tax=Wolbachia endosymbiont of Brugia malayi TaxID=80849 RepID=UPI00004C92D7|nr:hypothetical protein [Wolbachia endosymbiont of Brugia malayi]AAW70790.1 Predicted protein [Wolbachia endosymbiont strain TRS of Brugia malayi]QCB61762.1 hypothetical protein EJB10_03180 [Wolbachia endosymbiont of Brugia malayi]
MAKVIASHSNGQEPEGEELNYRKTHEALERWKEKWPSNYKRINKVNASSSTEQGKTGKMGVQTDEKTVNYLMRKTNISEQNSQIQTRFLLIDQENQEVRLALLHSYQPPK